MSKQTHNRRQFLQKSAAGLASTGAAALTPYWLTSSSARAQDEAKNDRPIVGCIGTGDRWTGAIGPQIKKYGDIVAVCDVDFDHVEKNGGKVAGPKADKYMDYRHVLDRKDVEIVTIVTPDHWHSKIAIEAMQAGKDVYCEKPLTLTIDEGKKICEVQKKTGRVFQVGTQQRDEFNTRRPPPGKKAEGKDDQSGSTTKPAPVFQYQFLQAVALAQSGRLGKIQGVKIVLRENPVCTALPKVRVPVEMNWDMWQGQAPVAEFVQGEKSQSSNKGYPAGRTHYEFRWWYEYSGGKMTDWGAHHIDIAQWAIGMDHSGPISIDGKGKFPVAYKNGNATESDRYNCAKSFDIMYKFPNDTEIHIISGNEDSMWITGDKAEIYVNRDFLKDTKGEVIASLADEPIPDDLILKLCKGKKPGNHMGNFIECVKDRSLPISDVFTHHRAVSTCHLGNIAMRLDRPLKWDPDKEEFVGDSDANTWLAREQRKGYEIKV